MEDWVTAANVAWVTTYMLMARDVLVREHFSSNSSDLSMFPGLKCKIIRNTMKM